VLNELNTGTTLPFIFYPGILLEGLRNTTRNLRLFVVSASFQPVSSGTKIRSVTASAESLGDFWVTISIQCPKIRLERLSNTTTKSEENREKNQAMTEIKIKQ
jgi:hypothetical protein